MPIVAVAKFIVPPMFRFTVLAMFRVSSAETSLSKSPTTDGVETAAEPIIVTEPKPLWNTVIEPELVDSGSPVNETSGAKLLSMSMVKSTVPVDSLSSLLLCLVGVLGLAMAQVRDAVLL
jgi:hypothetical protein